MTDQPYRCPYCDHWRTYERLLLAQGELTQSQERVRELEKRLAVAEELIKSALIGYKVLKNLCKNADLIAGYEASVEWIKDFEAFLAHQPGDYVAVRREDLKFIVDVLTTPETLTIYEEIVRLQSALNSHPATNEMIKETNAHRNNHQP